LEKRTAFCNCTKFGPKGDGLGHTRGFREGVLEEVEVGEDGKDKAPAAAQRTLAARHGASRSERMVRMGRGQLHDEP